MSEGAKMMGSRPVLLFLALSQVPIPAGNLAGRVFPAEGGAPLAKVSVILSRLTGGLSGIETVDTSQTDSSGRYAFAKVGAGRWQIEAQAPDRRSSIATAYRVDSGESVLADLVLRKGSGVLGPGAVTGLVRDAADGKGLRATVVLFRLAYSEQDPAPEAFPVDTAKTDSLGWYMLDSLDFRTGYLITASAPGYADAADSAVTVAMRQTLNRNFGMARLRSKGAMKRAAKK